MGMRICYNFNQLAYDFHFLFAFFFQLIYIILYLNSYVCSSIQVYNKD